MPTRARSGERRQEGVGFTGPDHAHVVVARFGRLGGHLGHQQSRGDAEGDREADFVQDPLADLQDGLLWKPWWRQSSAASSIERCSRSGVSVRGQLHQAFEYSP